MKSAFTNDPLISVSSLRIVADENIPCVHEAFGDLGEIKRVQGRDIGPSDVREADVLLIRSVTSIEPPLLDDSSVQFVGSATIGTDHINEEYLTDKGIVFAHAPASNADSVADYIISALLTLARRKDIPLQSQTVGIIGCGNIGGRLVRRLSALGLSVLPNDPPRAQAAEVEGRGHDFVSLNDVLRQSDILTLHVPLTTDGPHPTYHLMNNEAFRRLQSDAWILNTSRGSVVDGAALLDALREGRIAASVLDVWENEPTPDEALVRAVDIATPHIAGYAYDGKVRGTTMLYVALCDHFEMEPTWDETAVLAPKRPEDLACNPPDPRLPRTDWLYHLVRQVYDVRSDDERLRHLLDLPSSEQNRYFQHLRATYPKRREFQRYTIPRSAVPATYRRAVEEGLTLQYR